MRKTIIALALLSLAITACGRNDTSAAASAATASTTSAANAATAASGSSASASTTIGGATLQTSTVAIADLNPAIAARYGIDPSQEGLLLLVTVRDAAGNGIDAGDLQLSATASVLPDPPKPLELRSIHIDGMTDYIGVLQAKAPATAQFKIAATRGGSRADIATTTELYPR